jgi:YesN/AraC family two-component response regulator
LRSKTRRGSNNTKTKGNRFARLPLNIIYKIKNDREEESMAEKYSVNADYFSKIFKKATGVGFSKYLNATRLSAAQEMLATTTVSITDVALECGFNDSNYFIQVFKKVHGMTPKKYSMQFRLKK